MRIKIHGLAGGIGVRFSVALPKSPVAGSTTVSLQLEQDHPTAYHKKGSRYGYIEDPRLPDGTVFTLEDLSMDDDTAEVHIVCSPTTPITQGAITMTGNVFEGVVVKTITVPAGEGVTSGVQKSEIVLTIAPFAAKDVESAKAIVLAAAIAKGLKVDDPVVVVEVKVRQYA